MAKICKPSACTLTFRMMNSVEKNRIRHISVAGLLHFQGTVCKDHFVFAGLPEALLSSQADGIQDTAAAFVLKSRIRERMKSLTVHFSFSMGLHHLTQMNIFFLTHPHEPSNSLFFTKLTPLWSHQHPFHPAFAMSYSFAYKMLDPPSATEILLFFFQMLCPLLLEAVTV